MQEIRIADKTISVSSPAFIVAELSGNHNHDYNIAAKSLEAMKDAGADAVKLQTYTADTLTIDSNNKYFRIKGGLWDGRTLYELYQEAYTPWEWQPKLKKIADELGLILFSTPFDKTAVDFLEEMNVPAYKVASFEANDLSLIEYIAAKGKPVIISTGMSSLSDIEEAIETCKKKDNKQIAILKCTSAYPAPFTEANLRTISNLKETFQTVVGLSDHTLGISVPIAAVALGAKIIEKHFILDENLGGPDAKFSLEPDQFKKMAKAIREVDQALGEVSYQLSEKVLKSKIFQRSLFVVRDIKRGERFSEKNTRSIRPGYGIAPKYLPFILGKKAKKDIERGTPLTWEII